MSQQSQTQVLAGIRKGRLLKVKVTHNGHDITLIYRRPTPMESSFDGLDNKALLRNFAQGWEGMQESDLLPGETNEPLEFSLMLYREFIDDNPQHWQPVLDEIAAACKQFTDRLEDQTKK